MGELGSGRRSDGNGGRRIEIWLAKVSLCFNNSQFVVDCGLDVAAPVEYVFISSWSSFVGVRKWVFFNDVTQ